MVDWMETENPIFIFINFVVIYTRALLCYHILIHNDVYVFVCFFLTLLNKGQCQVQHSEYTIWLQKVFVFLLKS